MTYDKKRLKIIAKYSKGKTLDIVDCTKSKYILGCH